MRLTNRGTTLIELMITLSILAIMLGIAAPSFRNYIFDNRIASQSNDFMSSVMIARSEASKRGINVNITAASAVGGNEFGNGWNVWADTNGDSAMGASEVIRNHEDLRANTLSTVSGVTTLTFLPSGYLSTTAAQTLRLCDSRTAETGRQIVVAATGRPNRANYACS